MQLLCKNIPFLLCALSHSLALSYYFAFTSVIEQLILVYNFTSDKSSYLSTAFQFAGIVGGILCSFILTKTGARGFKISSILIIFLTIFSKKLFLYDIFLAFIGWYISLINKNYAFLMTSTVLNGFFNLAQFSVAYVMSL